MTDAFTAASPHYRRARALAAHPMPLAAGEVAVLPRRRPVHLIRTSLQLTAGVALLAAMWVIL